MMDLLEISSYVLLLLTLLLTLSIVFVSCYYNKLRDTKLTVIAERNESIRRNHDRIGSNAYAEYADYDQMQNVAKVDHPYDHLQFNAAPNQ